MSTELTPWFDDQTKPCHPGMYDTYWYFEDQQKRRYWDGGRWCEDEQSGSFSLQLLFWRGLTKKP